MVHVAFHHLLHQLLPDFVVVRSLPAGQLVQYVKPALVAQFQKALVRRIVRHAHGVHIHLTDQVEVQLRDALRRRPPERRPRHMVVDPAHHDLFTVHVEPVALAHIDGAEAKTLPGFVQHLCTLPELDHGGVQRRRFRAPQFRIGKIDFNTAFFHRHLDGVAHGLPLRIQQRHRNRIGLAFAPEEKVHREGAVGFRIDGHAINKLRRLGLQPDRTVDAAEDPEVGHALGVVDRFVRRLIDHRHLEFVFSPEPDQWGDVVFELVERPLVHRSGVLSVYLDRRIRHHAVEHDEHMPPVPVGGNLERVTVVAPDRLMILITKAVAEFPEALKLPASRHCNLRPFSAVAPRRSMELPLHRVFRVAAGEIFTDRFRRSTGLLTQQHTAGKHQRAECKNHVRHSPMFHHAFS